MCDIMFIKLCITGGEEGEEGEVQEGGEERRHRPEPRLWLATKYAICARKKYAIASPSNYQVAYLIFVIFFTLTYFEA